MSADKFKQLSDAFLKISQGFAEVASVMGSADLEPVLLKRPAEVLESQEAISSNSSMNSEVSVSASTSQPAKKVKKEKDPNAPKRPLNAYFLFQRDYRAQIKSTHPDLAFAEMSRMINEAWEKMGAAEHSKYENEAKSLLEEFNIKNKAYKDGKDGKIEEVTLSKSSSTEEVAPVGQHVQKVFETSSEADGPSKKKKKKKSKESEISTEKSE